MKQFIILLLTFCCIQANAQKKATKKCHCQKPEDSVEINYDFNTKQYNNACGCVKNCGQIIIHVKNINPGLNNISLSGKSYNFNISTPSQFATPTNTNVSVPNMTSTGGLPIKSTSNSSQNMELFSQRGNKGIAPKPQTMESGEIQKMVLAINNFNISCEMLKPVKGIDSAIKNYLMTSDSLGEAISNRKMYLLSCAAKNNYDSDSLTHFNKIQPYLLNLLINLNRAYDNANNILTADINKYKSVNDITDSLTKTLQKIKDSKTKMDNAKYDFNITSILQTDALYSQNYFTFTESFHPCNSDQYRIILMAQPTDAGKKMGITSFSDTLSLNTNGGIKIDFSGGIFFNLFLNDRTYHYDSSKSAKGMTRIVQDNPTAHFLPSVGALMHVYCRKCCDVNWAGSFGISSNGTDLSYYLGGSLLYGKNRRFVISAGIAGKQISILNGAYQTGVDIPNANKLAQIPTTTAFRIGAFLSVSYNLN